MNVCSQCGGLSSYSVCVSCRALNGRRYKYAATRKYYIGMMIELLHDAEALGNSKPVSSTSAWIMQEQKETSLKRIDDLTGFLSLLREKIEGIETEVLIHIEKGREGDHE